VNDPSSEEQATSQKSRFPLQSVLARRSTTVGEALPDDFAVLDLDTGAYFSLGYVGGFIWDRLDGIATLGEIASAVALAFNVDEERAVEDLHHFVATLTSRRLVRLVTAQ